MATIQAIQAQVVADSQRWFPALYEPNPPVPLTAYFGLAVAGEAGEVADEIKKVARDGKSTSGLGAEMADVLVYLLLLADHLSIDLESELAAKRAHNQQRFGGGE